MSCKAKTKKSGYKKRCGMMWTLPDGYCIFHSKSAAAKEWRKRPRKKRAFDREKLLSQLVRDYKNVEKTKAKPIIKLRLRATLSGQILEVLRDLNRIQDLEKLIEQKL